MRNRQAIEQDYLALGLTAAPMFMGVNMKLFFVNLMLSALVCIDAHTPYGILLFIALHLAMVRLSVNEPHFHTLYLKSFFVTPITLNSAFWGGINSYKPW